MLKSIVNGAEHDIVRIPMKGKNLARYWKNAYVSATGVSPQDKNAMSYPVKLKSGDRIRFHTTSNFSRCFATFESFDGTNLSNVLFRGTSNNIDYTASSDCYAVVWVNLDNNTTMNEQKFNDCKPMLNLGSTALPYEPYGYQEGWEVRDNQDRLIWGREDELQTATGTLPFKGYSLPLKPKSLLGNAVQNGTPAPDNIIIPEMCGVKTVNICPSAAAETKTNNGIIVVSNGSGTYHVSGTATEDADIRFNIQSFLIPKSVNERGSGTYSMFNSATYANADVKMIFYYQGTKVDDWGMTVCNRTNISYVIMSEKDCDAIGFTVKSGVTVDFTISPEFTNDGVLPTEFEPYGYKITFDNNGENLIVFPYFSQSGMYSGVQFTVSDDGKITANGTTAGGANFFISRPIDLEIGTYTISISGKHSGMALLIYDSTNSRVIASVGSATSERTFEVDDSNLDIRIYFNTGSASSIDIDCYVMLNLGTEALPYSPYLNKTTPIYLGEVPTIRRIKKLVLTGNEPWIYESAYTRFYIEFQNSLIIGLMATPAFCTHFQVISDGRPLADVPNDSMYSNSNVYMRWFFKQTEYTTVDAWKSYLADQYANGTPVTIWYILANPQTGIVNEPLAKIGNYADELTDISVHNLSAPLYGIGDYKDILNLSTGVVTRKIKELVLTGKENWGSEATNMYHIPCDMPLLGYNNAISDRYSMQDSYANVVNTDGAFGISRRPALFIHDNRYTTVANFKAYLAAQYAAGTPVTVWYVLNTPTTETVTVPTGMTGEIEGYLKQISVPTPTHQSIPKWNGKEETGGTYAVTVYTLPEIPTTTGQNTLTVETEKIHGLTNPLCGIGNYKDVLNLSTGVIKRKVKKLVLTGEENWNDTYGVTMVGALLNNVPFIPTITAISDRYVYNPIQSGLSTGLADGEFALQKSGEPTYGYNYNLAIKDSRYASVADLKAYLADQYANGTPVTIWYVVETPETETITVPYGLDCTVEGYLTQSVTPTPSNPITPESNGILESDGTYAVEVSLVPSNLTVKGHIKAVQ